MWFLLLLIVKAKFCVAQEIAHIDETPSKILLMFPSSHPIVVHYENSTSYIVDNLFASGFQWIIHFVNHDVLHDFLRPAGESVLNVVALDNQTLFLRYSWTDYNVEQEDVVFFVEDSVTKADGAKPLWKDPTGVLPWTNSIIYILAETQLYYVCYCCGKRSSILQEVTVKQIPILMKTFRICYDFNGTTFKVAYISYKPFFWCEWGL